MNARAFVIGGGVATAEGWAEPLLELETEPLRAPEAARDVIADVRDRGGSRGGAEQVVKREDAPGFRGRNGQAPADVVQRAARHPTDAILDGVERGQQAMPLADDRSPARGRAPFA